MNNLPESVLPNLPRQSVTCQKYLRLQTLTARARYTPGVLRQTASLAGSLVVSAEVEAAGAEWAIASNIAGAAFLGIDSQVQRLKLWQQQNACDFLVNSLDEALRILKNELRKGRPISVGLEGSAEEILPQMVARGIQPEFLIDSVADTPAAHASMLELQKRGALLVEEAAERDGPRMIRWVVEDRKDFEQMDALALSVLPTDDTVRRCWLQNAAAYFYRQRPLERVLSVSSDEATALQLAMQNPEWRSALRGTVTFENIAFSGDASSSAFE